MEERSTGGGGENSQKIRSNKMPIEQAKKKYFPGRYSLSFIDRERERKREIHERSTDLVAQKKTKIKYR